MSAAAPDVDVDVDVDVGDGGGIARPSRAPDDAASTARDDARDADADDQRLGLLDVATPRGEFVVVALDAPRDDGDGDGDATTRVDASTPRSRRSITWDSESFKSARCASSVSRGRRTRWR